MFSSRVPKHQLPSVYMFYNDNLACSRKGTWEYTFCNTSINESIVELQTFYFWLFSVIK